ncbi:hypothetical protein Plec18167_004255 [Paecilomyces lecythidis]|uniref:Uncharacterized protein n=1 Tax=Paecilomyces lecythidis TaxID=3004212 RepID=A0ABR3XTF0_9EURO
MTTFLSPLLHRPLLYASIPVGVGLSLLHPSSPFRAAPIQCQYVSPYPNIHASQDSGWAFDPKTEPLLQKQGKTGPRNSSGWLNASTLRQLSLGSVLGVLAGLGLRAFSKALVVLLGVGVVVVEWAASKGYNLIPVHRLQKYAKGIDLERAVHQNVAFKISFGATMALAAFSKLQ